MSAHPATHHLPPPISQHTADIASASGEGNGTPLQYSCLENPMDGGAWKATVHGVTKGRTRLSDFTFTFHFHALEKEMATHSSVLAWRIPGTGEPGGFYAAYGVAQSRTRLKRLSSSSPSTTLVLWPQGLCTCCSFCSECFPLLSFQLSKACQGLLMSLPL